MAIFFEGEKKHESVLDNTLHGSKMKLSFSRKLFAGSHGAADTKSSARINER